MTTDPCIPFLSYQIKDVLVTQDETIPSEGLYVEEVEVTSSRGDHMVFPVHCWTSPDKVQPEDGNSYHIINLISI